MEDSDKVLLAIISVCIIGIIIGGGLFIINYASTDPRLLKCELLDKEFFLTQTLNKTSLEFAYDNCLYLTEKIMEVRNN